MNRDIFGDSLPEGQQQINYRGPGSIPPIDPADPEQINNYKFPPRYTKYWRARINSAANGCRCIKFRDLISVVISVVVSGRDDELME